MAGRAGRTRPHGRDGHVGFILTHPPFLTNPDRDYFLLGTNFIAVAFMQ